MYDNNTIKQLFNRLQMFFNIIIKLKAEVVFMKKTYKIEVDCANCAAKMEEAAKNTEGVKDASVNFMMLKMKVEFEEGADVEATMEKVLANCKKVESDCQIFYA